MAIRKDIPHSSGYNISYWVITRINVGVSRAAIDIELRGYKDRGMRLYDVNGSAMAYRSYRITGDDFFNFVSLPAPQDFPWFDPEADYTEGTEVQYNRLIYAAEKDITAAVAPDSTTESPDDLPGQPTDEGDVRDYPDTPPEALPENSADWTVRSDGSVSRADVYTYIRSVDEDFQEDTQSV